MSKNAKARNSTPRTSKRKDTNINTTTNKNTECTGLYTKITNKEAKKIKNFKIYTTLSESIEFELFLFLIFLNIFPKFDVKP